MNAKDLLPEIEADLQKGRFVVYLEGRTDPEMFFALLGVAKPVSDTLNDVFVKGLEKGSGGSAVRARVYAARTSDLALVTATGGVLGIVDGDGRELTVVGAEFDAPHSGPLFSWKSYCIENLLAKAAWPQAWGSVPNWSDVLFGYVPYAALNRVHLVLRSALETLRIEKFRHPEHGKSLETEADIRAALGKDKGLLTNRDVEAMFDTEAATVRAAIAASLDSGHAAVNGKWLLQHHARTVTNKSEQQCRTEWCDAVRAAGGLTEVRDLWQRITGSTP
jgi:hypothetical protein